MPAPLSPLLFSLQRRRLLAAGMSTAGLAAAMLHPTPARAAESLYQKSFADVDDRQRPLSDFLGKPLVVNFWATWCPPCVHEMPDLQALHEQHPQAGFVGLAVDTAVNVRKFSTKQVQVSYPLLIVGFDGIDLMRPLGNTSGGLPFTVVFDAQGRVSERMIGPVKPDNLARVLQRLVGRA